MSEVSELKCTVKAYRPWSVKVPIGLNPLSFHVKITPDWVSLRAAKLMAEYMQKRSEAGEPFLCGFICCELLVVPHCRGGVITVVFSHNTVMEAGLAFATPGDLQGELNHIATVLMAGFSEREAIVECHGMVTHLEVASS